LSYLTRLGPVSHRASSLSPFFAFTDSARTLPEELVNSASAVLPFGFPLEESCQPAWPDFSPVTWDYPGDLRRLSFGRFSEPPESSAPCWRTVATIYPLGNCDSPRLETCPGYLTQLGAVSHRSSSLSSFFAITGGAERRQRNW
jgi:hypothetical protein